MSVMVRVNEDTHQNLMNLKREDESMDDVIRRLLNKRREKIDEGAGFWKDSDAVNAARKARKSMKKDIGL